MNPLDMQPMEFPDFKSVPEEEIDEILSEKNYNNHTPFSHQKNTVAAGLFHTINYGCWPNLSDMGTGKSFSYAIVLYNLINFEQYPIKRVLCVGSSTFLGNNNAKLYPNGLAGELRKWGDFEVEVIERPGSYGRSIIQKNGIFLTNWESLRYLYPKPIDAINGKAWDVMIFDEAHKSANPEAQMHKIAYELAARTEFVIGGTGTIFADKPQDAFGVMKVIDGGETFGTDKDAFYDKYFSKNWFISGQCPICHKYVRFFIKDGENPHRKCYKCKADINAWALRRGKKFPKFEFRDEMKEDFIKRLYARSIVYKAEELKNMPDEVVTTHYVTMHPDQEFMYKNILTNFMIEDDMGKMAACRTKMSQVAGGFLQEKDCDPEWILPIAHNPKLKFLDEFATDYSGKIVVFTRFRYEIELIKQLLKKRKEKFVEVHGGVTKKKRSTAEASFTNDDKIRWFIGTAAACKEGLNLWKASVTIYYSLSQWLLDYTQSSKRTKRPQQKESFVRIIILAANNSNDVSKTQSIFNKKQLNDSLSSEEFYKQMRGEV